MCIFVCFYQLGNICASNPCKNGGTCIESVEGFNCTCVSGTGGFYCEVKDEFLRPRFDLMRIFIGIGAGIIGIVLLGCILSCCCKRRKQRKNSKKQADDKDDVISQLPSERSNGNKEATVSKPV